MLSIRVLLGISENGHMNETSLSRRVLYYFVYILLVRNFSCIQFARKHHYEDNVVMNVMETKATEKSDLQADLISLCENVIFKLILKMMLRFFQMAWLYI